ncbi:hypothetical protein [Acaryochloris sp. CCMEE 5410]|uniref:hypothetical protein n=1 Tax=Acaryochloris sp. CCMEE 5410 TaxID=310037 RepID=UPI0002483FE0|nr:hypothetical protein [Acaryochloris sp. CCMEE 5410]KAI9129365.1 hypothetical protein ON05_035160 [Acaryochloris sp. CCMEE 5410]
MQPETLKETLQQAQRIVERFGSDPDFRSPDIQLDEVKSLMDGLLASLAPYISGLEGTAQNLYKGLLEWRDDGQRYDRVYNLRSYLYKLSKTLLEHGLKGQPQAPLDGVPF